MTTEQVHQRRWAILAALSLSVFLVVVDNTIVNVALPTIARDLQATTSDLQWIVDAYALVFAGLLLAAGGLGDRWGRKGTLQVGLVLFGGTSALAALADSPTQLVAARALMGVGASLVFPATLAILSHTFTDATERAKAIGVWSAVVGLAVAAGPITGGALLEHHSWGSVFLVNIPIVVVALLAGRSLLPTSRDPGAGPIDYAGLLLSTAGIGTLVFAVIEAPEAGWTSASTLTLLAAAAALTAGFVAREARTAHPLLDVSLFRDRRFSTASLAVTIAAFALFGMVFLMTQYLQLVRGDDTLEAGVHTLPYALTNIVMAPVAARLAIRAGTRRVVVIGMLLIAGGLALAGMLDAESSYWMNVLPSMVVMAMGVTFVFMSATDAIMASVPVEKAGAGSAVNDTTREVGGTLGVAILGSVFSSVYGAHLLDRLDGLALPGEVVARAEESMGAAVQVAADLGRGPGDGVLVAARDAFASGMSAALLVAAGVAAAGALVARLRLPGPPTAAVVAADDAAAVASDVAA